MTAIAAVGHVPTAVLVDDHGHPLRPAITWQDSRARHEANELEDQLGPVEGDLGTELPWSPSQLVPKLAWVSAHEPALRLVFARRGLVDVGPLALVPPD